MNTPTPKTEKRTPTMTSTPHPAEATSVADQLEITAVLHRLARAMDTRDWALLETCFTPDAVGMFATGPTRGTAAIREQYEAFLTPLEATQHLITNTEVTTTGHSARATSYFHAQHVRTLDDGIAHFVIGGRYDDAMSRTADGWRITERTVAALWSDGDQRVVAATLQPSQHEAQDAPEQERS